MSENKSKIEDKKEDLSKNQTSSPQEKPIYNQELSEEECSKLISIIKSHFIPEEILYRIRPELKESYISRKNDNLESANLKSAMESCPTGAISIGADKCNCCEECTGDEACNCGCEECNCNEETCNCSETENNE